MKYQKVFSKRDDKWKWGVDGTIIGVRIRRADWDTKKEAEEAMAALRIRARELRYGMTSTHRNTITLGDLATKIKERGLTKAKAVALAIALETWGASRELASLTRPDMNSIKEAFDARELEPSSVATYRGALYAMLNCAGDFFAELAEWTPPKFPKCERPQPRQRTLRQDEIAGILAILREPGRLKGEQPRLIYLRRELHDIARLMLLTGARREQVMKITRESIDWQQGLLNLHSGKVKRWHIIPLSETAKAILQRRATADATNLFRPLTSNQILYACRRLPGYGQAEGWTPHDCRRTAATVIESAGIAYSAVAALLGHKRRDMTAVYTVAQLSEMRRAVTTLEAWCREIEGFTEDEYGEKKNLEGKRESRLKLTA